MAVWPRLILVWERWTLTHSSGAVVLALALALAVPLPLLCGLELALVAVAT